MNTNSRNYLATAWTLIAPKLIQFTSFLDVFARTHVSTVATLSGDTLAEGYERTVSRLEQITRAGYRVKVQWECEFEEKPNLLTHSVVRQTPLRTCDALYGSRTEAMRFHYKVRENETIQYVDVMSLYTYLCKYFNFPVGHPVIMW